MRIKHHARRHRFWDAPEISFILNLQPHTFCYNIYHRLQTTTKVMEFVQLITIRASKFIPLKTPPRLSPGSSQGYETSFAVHAKRLYDNFARVPNLTPKTPSFEVLLEGQRFLTKLYLFKARKNEFTSQ